MINEQTLRIKGMVCQRCIISITEVFSKLGFFIKDISLGKITFGNIQSESDTNQAQQALLQLGFEVIPDKNDQLIQEIKKQIDAYLLLLYNEGKSSSFSSWIQTRIPVAYDRLSELFSSTEGLTVEKYIIQKRMDKVKELLVYTSYTLTDIADITGFSSVHHLSRQFKEISGITPTAFKQNHSSHQVNR